MRITLPGERLPRQTERMRVAFMAAVMSAALLAGGSFSACTTNSARSGTDATVGTTDTGSVGSMPAATAAPGAATSSAGTPSSGLAAGPPPTAGATGSGQCRYTYDGGRGPLPDPACTPGASDPAVTQQTIGSTICTAGYTSGVRPPESVTEPQKFASMSQYGATGSASAYEYDHLIPLELGGSPDDTANLWPEPLSGAYGAHAKDALENTLNHLVCDGRLSLDDARSAISRDWVAAYDTYAGTG